MKKETTIEDAKKFLHDNWDKKDYMSDNVAYKVPKIMLAFKNHKPQPTKKTGRKSNTNIQ